MNILVMGGTSFVSKCFAMFAIDMGYTVDIFTRGNIEVDYEGVNEHLIGDRKDTENLKKIITKAYDYIVDISAYFEEDVKMLCEVLDTSQLKRYVLCSTCSVYMMPPAGQTITEESPRGFDAIFGGDYGYNKMKAEDYLMEKDIPVTIFRPTYIYGEYNNVFRDAYLFESIENGKVNTLEDVCPVQFVYVWDLVKTFESCFHVDASINQAYNVTNPLPIRWSNWIEAGFYATGKEAEICIYTEEMVENSEVQIFPFGNADVLFSTDKLKKHGLFVPNTTIKDGLKKTYNWYKTVGPSVITKRRFDIV